MMIKNLVKIANKLDRSGLAKEADVLDLFLDKVAMGEISLNWAEDESEPDLSYSPFILQEIPEGQEMPDLEIPESTRRELFKQFIKQNFLDMSQDDYEEVVDDMMGSHRDDILDSIMERFEMLLESNISSGKPIYPDAKLAYYTELKDIFYDMVYGLESAGTSPLTKQVGKDALNNLYHTFVWHLKRHSDYEGIL